MPMEHIHRFDTRPALAQALADAVVAALEAALAERGAASLAVSGGSTPKLFFEVLSQRPLDWANVTVTLVDERFVPPEQFAAFERIALDLGFRNVASGPMVRSSYHADRQAAGV